MDDDGPSTFEGFNSSVTTKQIGGKLKGQPAPQ